jgi:hypothetical protein
MYKYLHRKNNPVQNQLCDDGRKRGGGLLGPRQRDVGAVAVGEEADLASAVAPHGGEDDHVLLRALEPVHGPHLHRESVVHVVRFAELLLDGADLALVRRHHAHPDVAPRVHRLLKQPLHNPDHSGGLDGVDQAPVGLAGALAPAVDVDERVGAEHGARQVPPLVAPLQDVGAVGDPAIVEAPDWELAYPRMHPVLHVEEMLGLSQ